jgi:uncharacterized protein YegL
LNPSQKPSNNCKLDPFDPSCMNIVVQTTGGKVDYEIVVFFAEMIFGGAIDYRWEQHYFNNYFRYQYGKAARAQLGTAITIPKMNEMDKKIQDVNWKFQATCGDILDSAFACDKIASEMEIVFVVDGSGSVSGTDFLLMKNMMKSVMQYTSDDATVSVVQFNSWARTEFSQEQSYKQVLAKIDKVSQTGGGTNIADALSHVYHKIPLKSDKRLVVIVMTDGHSYGGSILTEADKLINYKKASIISIGIGSGVSTSQLKEVIGSKRRGSSDESKYTWTVPSMIELNDQRDEMAGKICKAAP